MGEREYIAALERDLKDSTERLGELERGNQLLRISCNNLTITVGKLEKKIEQLRQAICAVAASTNKVQRIIAGETE